MIDSGIGREVAGIGRKPVRDNLRESVMIFRPRERQDLYLSPVLPDFVCNVGALA
jgi:hypothetical protein